VFDALIYFHQIRELAEMARALPQLTIIVNHFGGLLGTGPYAGKYPEIFPVWREDIKALAACPNVFMKLGGLGNRGRGFGFYDWPTPPSSEDLAKVWQPWVDVAIEAFTPYRCTFESNFPVDKASCTYQSLWNAFKRMSAGYSADERAALFAGTARKAYRLPT
jgi:predicted TIM-barrel fold metal-dependent hydrolase